MPSCMHGVYVAMSSSRPHNPQHARLFALAALSVPVDATHSMLVYPLAVAGCASDHDAALQYNSLGVVTAFELLKA